MFAGTMKMAGDYYVFRVYVCTMDEPDDSDDEDYNGNPFNFDYVNRLDYVVVT